MQYFSMILNLKNVNRPSLLCIGSCVYFLFFIDSHKFMYLLIAYLGFCLGCAGMLVSTVSHQFCTFFYEENANECIKRGKIV